MRPAWVSSRGRLPRSSKITPRRRSTSCTCWLAADWLTPQCSAPRLMLLVLERFQGEREDFFGAQNVAAEIAIDAARLGEFQGPLAAIEQDHPQTTFHLLHVLEVE